VETTNIILIVIVLVVVIAIVWRILSKRSSIRGIESGIDNAKTEAEKLTGIVEEQQGIVRELSESDKRSEKAVDGIEGCQRRTEELLERTSEGVETAERLASQAEREIGSAERELNDAEKSAGRVEEILSQVKTQKRS
jgi:chromosome segregation ATPase